MHRKQSSLRLKTCQNQGHDARQFRRVEVVEKLRYHDEIKGLVRPLLGQLPLLYSDLRAVGQTAASTAHGGGNRVHRQQVGTAGSQEAGQAAVGACRLKGPLIVGPRQGRDTQTVLSMLVPSLLEVPGIRLGRIELLEVGERKRHTSATTKRGPP